MSTKAKPKRDGRLFPMVMVVRDEPKIGKKTLIVCEGRDRHAGVELTQKQAETLAASLAK